MREFVEHRGAAGRHPECATAGGHAAATHASTRDTATGRGTARRCLDDARGDTAGRGAA